MPAHKDLLETFSVWAVFLGALPESVKQRVTKTRNETMHSLPKQCNIKLFGFAGQDLHPIPKKQSDLLNIKCLVLSKDRL